MNRSFGSWFGRKSSSRRDRDSDMLSSGGTSYSSSPTNSFPSSSSAYTTTSSSTKNAPCEPPPYSEIFAAAPMTPASIAARVPSTQIADLDGDKYSFLRKFDTLFLVDDSGSMKGRNWKDAGEAISAIAPICTKYDSDGVDIYFLNHRNRHHPSRGYVNVKSPDAVRRIFDSVQPSGLTEVGEQLDRILSPYLDRVKKMAAADKDEWNNLKDPSLLVRPINIISITDGDFSDDVEGVVVAAAKKLDRADAKAHQVGIQFVQIGNDARAQKALKSLDDGLTLAKSNRGMRDIVDTVPWKGSSNDNFTAEYLLKVVLGSVNRRYDREEV
ncbi:hypothetical protein PISL3812_06476 [Talaromyces islandicus]|uniref:VWFA domain-containing protein n=1 Tax=Talaromyces islandicus TaxID=28573 RepID=A0A0U1M342_TALIS|nr:hypothetical protein PISL3812_06476 [Talaromyces islandicus]